MKVTKDKYNVEHIITPYNKDNEREVEMMVGKAMCAYANWQSVKDDRDRLTSLCGRELVEKSLSAHESEYEATVRCIAMFVEQPTSYICSYIISRCYEKFGIC